MTVLDRLFDNNSAWAEEIKKQDPRFFNKLSEQQSPEYLWIGCSDSRVPANEIVGMLPGELFVHRNIANMVIHTDLNCLSVVQYAIDVLKVKHIIVCGHYGCGGVTAVVQDKRYGLVDNWLQHIKDIYYRHEDRFERCLDEEERVDVLCEINVVEQVLNLCRTTMVQDAWNRGQELSLHGLIYSIRDGILRDLQVTYDSIKDVPAPMRIPVLLGRV
ncbi:MAG: carbonate dehydratase [Gammaproteobacteria bacterium]|nr:carbonate dehydratase [Gammaproteobacteria bacterium]